MFCVQVPWSILWTKKHILKDNNRVVCCITWGKFISWYNTLYLVIVKIPSLFIIWISESPKSQMPLLPFTIWNAFILDAKLWVDYLPERQKEHLMSLCQGNIKIPLLYIIQVMNMTITMTDWDQLLYYCPSFGRISEDKWRGAEFMSEVCCHEILFIARQCVFATMECPHSLIIIHTV